MNHSLSVIGKQLRDRLDGDMLRGLSKQDVPAAAYGGTPSKKVEGDKFSPIKTVTVQETIKRSPEVVVTTQQVRVEHTKWFDASKYEPGQPGVFEVDRVHQFDNPEIVGPRRFSYFNGKQFGPLSTNPEAAFNERFNVSSLSSSIKSFRGLKEAS